ncbi:hypothetical protein BHE74_00051305 [Ensete ventricosum]|nr:hypothetical protein GW17_00026083 [Ensete ventricosum]RWW43076.1 hypothetical protein BHE74_00051305 [Ensete ventricosum]
MEERWERSLRRAVVAVLVLALAAAAGAEGGGGRRHAYAAMMYMGTPRDYEFYVATRVMMRSLTRLGVDADLVVVASPDVPLHWVQTLKEADGVKVVTVANLKNPYEEQGNFNTRFKLTLNKLYAWSLVSYDRVVMLDSDNLFLQRTDELFQCGNLFLPGLRGLQPSMVVFKDMLHELEMGRENPDGADQGFLVSYFPDLLDRPMFHPPANGSKMDGTYRLPLGYQMDASYYCEFDQQIRGGGAGDADPGGDIPGNHGGHAASTAGLVEALLQPEVGEEHPFPAHHGEGGSTVVHVCGTRRALLPRPANGASASGLAALPARSSCSVLDRDRRLPAPSPSGTHAVVGDIGFPVCDGVPLVLGWRHQGSGFACLRLLLCSGGVGIADESGELLAQLTRTGGLLS